LVEGFTKKYNVKQLVWYEAHEDIHEAIRRETLVKKWKRRWKLELIEKRQIRIGGICASP
jgi:putative endonuclease